MVVKCFALSFVVGCGANIRRCKNEKQVFYKVFLYKYYIKIINHY